MRDVLLIIFVGASSIAALFRPFFGLLVFVFLGYFAPQSLTWTIGKSLPLSQFVAVGTIVGYFLGSERRMLPVRRESIILLLLWLIFGMSTIYAINPANAYERLIYISKILLMVLLSTSLVNSEERFLALMRVIALSIGFYGLKGGIFTILTGGNYNVYGPDQNFLSANNTIGLTLAMNIPFLFFLQKYEKNRWLRWLSGGMAVFSVPAVIGTFSRGAWLGMAAAVVPIALRSRKKLLLVVGTLVVLTVAAPAFVNIIPDRIVTRYGELTNYKEEGSAESRFWNWETCKRVGAGNPLHGGGFDFYSREIYEKYYPEFLIRWPGKVWSCHSIWFTIFGEHGFPGLVLWVALIVSCFFSLRQIRRSEKKSKSMPEVYYYSTLLHASLFAYIVAGTFLDAAYFDIFYFVVAMIIICKNLFVQSRQSPAGALP